MTLIEHIPALVRVAMVFVIIVLLIHRKVSLGHAFMAGSLVLSLLFRLTPLDLLKSILSSLTDLKTLFLALIVSLILVFSNSLELSGQMKRLLANFQGLIRNRKLNLIIFPALIGLLPMPGGAIFSAPMVKQIGSQTVYPPDVLSFTNYWFRHIWEYWWPLYPGVLLATVLADLHLGRFIVFSFPMTLVVFATGYVLLRSPSAESVAGEYLRPAAGPFLKELLPILIVIFPGLGLGAFLSHLWPQTAVAKEVALVAALMVAILWVYRQNRLPGSELGSLLVSGKLLNLVYMIFAILVFKGVMEHGQAVTAISGELVRWRVPLVLIAVILPFLVGTVTGITIAFVGSTFPILIPLIRTVNPGADMLPYMILALACGFAGVMLSPVHLCFILSNEYFDIGMAAVYKRLWVPCLTLMMGSMAYFWVLHRFI